MAQWWPWREVRRPNPDGGLALVLSGGGARAAYQAGVLSALADLLPRGSANPFPIICGTSAGALNATALAVQSQNFRLAVRGMERVWRHITPDQVYRTELMAYLRSLLRWFLPTFLAGVTPVRSALLDSRPLEELLRLAFNLNRIQQGIDAGGLRALCITASSYLDGESVSFFQAHPSVQGWQRARRRGERCGLGIEHLLASSAIPILFPAQRIGDRYYGDGAVRQLAPLSAALHLGASRILVIGVSSGVQAHQALDAPMAYPSMAQVLGHVLNSVFADTLEVDLERLERINQTVGVIPPAARARMAVPLQKVEALKMLPSEPIDELAGAYLHRLPRSLRFILRGTGGTRSAGATAISYLLFDPGFCQALLDLGRRDALARREELMAFVAACGSK